MNYSHNKYSKYYFSIVTNAKSRDTPPNLYTERHHIIPKSLGGSNSQENLVRLTAKEHYLCHILLTKMVVGLDRNKMAHAAWRMICTANRHQDRHKANSRTYAMVRALYIEQVTGRIMSDSTKEKLRQANLGKKASAEAKAKMSKSRTGKTLSAETRAKMSTGMQGKNAGKQSRMGAILSDETKQTLSIKAKLVEKKTCPQCSKTVSPSNYSRWHGAKCGQPVSDEYRMKQSAAQKARRS